MAAAKKTTKKKATKKKSTTSKTTKKKATKKVAKKAVKKTTKKSTKKVAKKVAKKTAKKVAKKTAPKKVAKKKTLKKVEKKVTKKVAKKATSKVAKKAAPKKVAAKNVTTKSSNAKTESKKTAPKAKAAEKPISKKKESSKSDAAKNTNDKVVQGKGASPVVEKKASDSNVKDTSNVASAIGTDDPALLHDEETAREIEKAASKPRPRGMSKDAIAEVEDLEDQVSGQVSQLSEIFGRDEIQTAIRNMELFIPASDDCRQKDCENLATTLGYCRFHYIQNWKEINRKREILKEGQLQDSIEQLIAKYPANYIQSLLDDLGDEGDFNKMLVDLNIVDSDLESVDFESNEEDDDIEIETRTISGGNRPRFEEE